MRHFILAMTLIISQTTLAKADFSKSLELCAMQWSEDPDSYEKAFSESTIYVNKATSITAQELKMVNSHLLEQEYVSAPLNSLAEVQALFTTGEQQYNDLYLITMTSKSTGQVFSYVKSYPGDNPYGLVFNPATGELLAYNQDDNITLVKGSETFACPWQ
ncbi:hypothetical protein ACLVWU_10295 [Bdellovibrio sp. HCB290]|uniref:hypothetical protein n=1 Tax=Bdellovibrio sp. HCB290 TaxID=3394356 RepID=UPI0039B66E99